MSLDLGTLTGYLEMDDEKAESVLDLLPGKISGAGVAMGVAATGVAALIGSSLADGIGTGMDLESAKAKLTASLGLTQSESKRIGGIAGKLYSQAYGESIDDVSDAVGNVVSSIDGMRGATNSAVSDMTAKVLNFNSVFGIDTARTTQIVGQLIKSGLVKDADQGMDLLTRSMQKVPAAVREDLLDAVDEYTPFFHQLGISGDQAFNMLVQASAKGMYGIDKTGDAIKEFGIRATDLGDTNAQASLTALGLSGTQTADELLKGGDGARTAMARVVAALQSVEDPGRRAALAGGLFGTQIEDLNKGQLGTFLNSLANTSGAMDGVKGATDRMGTAINGPTKVGIEQFNRTWDMTVSKLTQQVVPALNAVFSFLNGHPGAITALAVAVGILGVAFMAMSVAAAVAAAAEAAVLWPVLLVVAGLAALIAVIALVVSHWGQITDFLTSTGGAIWGWLQGVIQGFVDWWNGIWGGFGAGVSAAWTAIVAFFTGLPATLLGLLVSLGQGILAGLAALPGLLYQGLTTGLALGLVALYAFFVLLPQLIVGWLATAGTWLLQKGMDLLRGMAAGITAGYVAVVAFFTALPGRVLGFVVSFATLLLERGLALLRGLASGITSGAAAVWSFLTALPGRVLGFLTSLPGLLISRGSDLLHGLANGITTGASAVWSFLTGLPGRIVSSVGNFGSTLLSAGGDLMRGLLRGIRDGLGNILGAIGGMAGDIMSKFKSILGIASPSKVFRSYGRFITAGLALGLDDGQAGIDARVSDLVSTPSLAVSATAAGAGAGAAAGSGVIVDARMTIENAGWTREELEREQSDRMTNALALMGLDDVIGVA